MPTNQTPWKKDRKHTHTDTQKWKAQKKGLYLSTFNVFCMPSFPKNKKKLVQCFKEIVQLEWDGISLINIVVLYLPPPPPSIQSDCLKILLHDIYIRSYPPLWEFPSLVYLQIIWNCLTIFEIWYRWFRGIRIIYTGWFTMNATKSFLMTFIKKNFMN